MTYDVAPTVPISPLKAVAHAAAAASTGPDIHHKETKKVPAPKTHEQRPNRQRNCHEKSGVPALDRDLPAVKEKDDVRTERDDDDYWDLIEADSEEHNNAHGTNLFLYGVVPRYRRAVFRKGSTLNRSTTTNDTERLSAAAAAVTTNGGSGSPSPTDKECRGRTATLPFRRKTFLCIRFLPSTSMHSLQSASAGKSFTVMSDRSGE